LFGYSRQAYYKREKRSEEKEVETMEVVSLVNKLRKRMPKLGGKKMYHLTKQELMAKGIKVGRDKFFDFLRENKLLIAHKKKYQMTTNSKHMFKKYPNLIKDLEITRKDQVWVSDITYIKTDEGYSYAAMVTDAYTRKVVGSAIDKSMTTKLVLNALDTALKSRKDYTDLIHHSDRGIQYCSRDYINKLLVNDISISMTENSDPYENALAERMNRTIKEEFIINEKVRSFPILEKLFYESIDIYNKERPHLSLMMKKPDEVYSMI
jgi:putative transposase